VGASDATRGQIIEHGWIGIPLSDSGRAFKARCRTILSSQAIFKAHAVVGSDIVSFVALIKLRNT
jgi:hypothetical protein